MEEVWWGVELEGGGEGGGARGGAEVAEGGGGGVVLGEVGGGVVRGEDEGVGRGWEGGEESRDERVEGGEGE